MQQMSSFGKTFEVDNSPLAGSDPFARSCEADSSLNAGIKPDMASSERSPHIKFKVNFAVELHPKGLSDKFKRFRNAFENGQSCMPRSPLKVLKTVYRMVSPRRNDRRSLLSADDCGEHNSGDYRSYSENARPSGPRRQSPMASPPVRIVVSSPGGTHASASDCHAAERKMREDVRDLLQNNFGNNRFEKGSPVAPKALDRSVAWLLKKNGVSKFCDLFQREEIDMPVFRKLTRDSIAQLGISKAKHQEKILRAVEYANKNY